VDAPINTTFNNKRQKGTRIMKYMHQWMAAVATMTALSASAAWGGIANLSDSWFSPQQKGNRINVVQHESGASISLMLFGPNGDPVWYSADDAEIYAYSADGLPFFRGTLNRVRGKWFGEAGSRAPETTPVGQVWFSPTTRQTAQLEFSIDGVTASLSVRRQVFGLPHMDIAYLGQLSGYQSLGDARSTRVSDSGTTTFVFDEMAAITINGASGRCDYSGNYRLAGKQISITGEYSCADGKSGPFQIDELEFTGNGFSAKLRRDWNGGVFTGTIGGPRR
jgi:hypothetical protein